MKKTWGSLLILTLILALLAGCGGGGNAKSGADSGGQTGQTGIGTPDSGKQDEIVELDLFINHSWYPVGPGRDRSRKKSRNGRASS